MIDIESPALGQGDEIRRISEIEKYLIRLADTLNTLPFGITGFERVDKGEGYDVVILTYPDGSRVRYRLERETL